MEIPVLYPKSASGRKSRRLIAVRYRQSFRYCPADRFAFMIEAWKKKKGYVKNVTLQYFW